jgi:hypothetical protein
VQEDKS